MRYKLCVSMYGGGRAMWYPGRGSFLLGSAVVDVGGGVRVAVARSVHLASVGDIRKIKRTVCEGGQ
jgi:hypothetical protein